MEKKAERVKRRMKKRNAPGRTLERYKKNLLLLESRYGAAKTMEEYDNIFEDQLAAVRHMRSKKALQNLDYPFISLLTARKEAFLRLKTL